MQNPLPAPPLPTPKARERSGDRTRRRLFETALAEFRRVGVTDASIGRIAETAGVSRPTFYFHFPTKDHVLLELQWSLEEPIAARMEAAKTLDDALADQPHYLMRAVAARFVEADADGRLPSGLDPERATHLFLTSVFGYLSLPVDIEESRRDLQTLISLFLTAPRTSGARRTRR